MAHRTFAVGAGYVDLAEALVRPPESLVESLDSFDAGFICAVSDHLVGWKAVVQALDLLVIFHC